VQQLVSLGAVVVGKTKTTQFTAGRDWIDVFAPFSSRGDHYHRLVGSSAGAFASLTGYDWLRHVVADDGTILLSTQEVHLTDLPSTRFLPRPVGTRRGFLSPPFPKTLVKEGLDAGIAVRLK
jgi:hypothetical protein